MTFIMSYAFPSPSLPADHFVSTVELEPLCFLLGADRCKGRLKPEEERGPHSAWVHSSLGAAGLLFAPNDQPGGLDSSSSLILDTLGGTVDRFLRRNGAAGASRARGGLKARDHVDSARYGCHGLI